MLLRNSNTGGLEVYDISNNQITNAAFIGTVGLDWQFSGVGNFSGVPGETDLLLRNVNTGGLEVYDINNDQLTGAAFIGTVGLDWQFAGIGPVHGAGVSRPWYSIVRSASRKWRRAVCPKKWPEAQAEQVASVQRNPCNCALWLTLYRTVATLSRRGVQR
jgi:hypothetical protein